jgi:hypothetical protein
VRVSEADVGRILLAIASEPNRRAKRHHGDPEGPYDYWFDGGAVSMLTSHIRYMFTDGTEAFRSINPQHVSVTIVFPNREKVTITQA